MMTQKEMIYNFTRDARPRFNDQLFERDDMDIIEELKKVILSSQRDSFFTIRVESFKVVDDYEEINKLLFDYNEIYKNKNKNRAKDNQYGFIDLKESDIRLLIVRYFIAIQNEKDYVDVYIAIPRIVDKYYLRISGNMYSAMYQIVDGSTYNNLTSNNKYSSVTLKTVFMPVRIYRYGNQLTSTKQEEVKAVYYVARIFNKSLAGMKYFLAKFGFVGAMSFIGIRNVVITQNDRSDIDKEVYSFKLANDSYISVPKVLMDADSMTQSFVYTVIASTNKDATFNDLYTVDYWIAALGQEFNNFTVQKGDSVIASLESIYDLTTKQNIRLPEDQKKDIYDILKWMMREFQNLRQKDNLDISFKKIRLAEYIASLYASKISKGIYRISDMQKRANIASIKKAIITHPKYLLSAIDKCKLVNYRNMVNDMDSLTALKFTYKGISGLGENNNNSIPDIYRAINVSHIGRIDLDSSSATDPGVTGTLCPYLNPCDGFIAEYQEPNFWEAEYKTMIDNYNSAIGIREVAEFRNNVLGEDNMIDLGVAKDVVASMEQLIKPAYFVNMQSKLDNVVYLEAGGMIYYEADSRE